MTGGYAPIADPAHAEAGARILLERELMSVPWFELVDKVEHDSKD